MTRYVANATRRIGFFVVGVVLGKYVSFVETCQILDPFGTNDKSAIAAGPTGVRPNPERSCNNLLGGNTQVSVTILVS